MLAPLNLNTLLSLPVEGGADLRGLPPFIWNRVLTDRGIDPVLFTRWVRRSPADGRREDGPLDLVERREAHPVARATATGDTDPGG